MQTARWQPPLLPEVATDQEALTDDEARLAPDLVGVISLRTPQPTATVVRPAPRKPRPGHGPMTSAGLSERWATPKKQLGYLGDTRAVKVPVTPLDAI